MSRPVVTASSQPATASAGEPATDAERAARLRAGGSLLASLLTTPGTTPESHLARLEAAGVDATELAVAGLDRDHLADAVREGCSARELARLVGVPVSLVEQVLARLGLEAPDPRPIDRLDVRCAVRDRPGDEHGAAALLARRVGVHRDAALAAIRELLDDEQDLLVPGAETADRSPVAGPVTARVDDDRDLAADDAIAAACVSCGAAPSTADAPAAPAIPYEERPLWQEVGLGFLSVFRGVPRTAAFAVVAAALVKALLLQVFVVPTPSMSPALLPGDRMVVEKVTYRLDTPQRGDVVVFEGGEVPTDDPIWRDALQLVGLLPADGTDYVKRVVGLPGETVVVREGRVTVDGTDLPDSFAIRDRSDHGPVVVPEGHLFVLGDNRPGSIDSRSPEIGFVAIDDVVGRATFVVLPRERWGRLNTWGLEGTVPTGGTSDERTPAGEG